jgi:FkbM family methyltransferase
MNASDPAAAAAAAYASGRYPEAAHQVREALRLAPGDAHLHLLHGEILLRLGSIAEALAAFNEASRLFPGLGLPFTRMATLRRRARHEARPPRAADAARARIQFSTLGSKGRFGNQLLQYGFARLYADRFGLELEVPDWIGRDLYGFDDPPPTARLPPLDEGDADFGAALRGESSQPLAGHDLSGYFCWDMARWGHVAQAFRNLYALREPLASGLQRALDGALGEARTLVALHLRRGDFGQGRFWAAPVRWYLEWLEALWPTLERPCLYIATDEPGLLAGFARFRPIDASLYAGCDLEGIEFIADHHALANAQWLAISNSSFSFTAAMLAPQLKGAVRPDPIRRRLVPFDPWASPVLLDAPTDPLALSPTLAPMLANLQSRAGVAAYLGEACAGWTNAVRAAFPRLSVLDIEPGADIDAQLAGGRPAHLGYLRLGKADDLGNLPEAASSALRHARIDAIEFQVGDNAGIGRQLARIMEHGYRLFAVRADGLQALPRGRVERAGVHVLVNQRLTVARPQPGQPMIDIGALALAHGCRLAGRGVLHVGAHEGQELPHYERLGMQPIVFVEANPAVFERLAANVRGRAGVQAVQRAASNGEGEVTLHLASFDQSSSLLPMAGHRGVYPGVLPAGEVKVRASPADAIVAEAGLSPSTFALLHIDVQGAEKMVLEGAGELLGHVDLVSLEVNFEELYEGCAQIEAIEALLVARGFLRVALASPYHPSWGDAVYARAMPPAPGRTLPG